MGREDREPGAWADRIRERALMLGRPLIEYRAIGRDGDVDLIQKRTGPRDGGRPQQFFVGGHFASLLELRYCAVGACRVASHQCILSFEPCCSQLLSGLRARPRSRFRSPKSQVREPSARAGCASSSLLPASSATGPPGSPPLRAFRHWHRWELYSPSRRSSRPTSPGPWQRSAPSRIRSRYAAENRRRVGFACTPGSGALVPTPGLHDAVYTKAPQANRHERSAQ